MTDSVEYFNTVLRTSYSFKFSSPHHSKNLFYIGRELLKKFFDQKQKTYVIFPITTN